MLPKIKENIRFADVTVSEFGGACLSGGGTFPSIAAAENLSVEELPTLAPRASRRSVFKLPEKSEMIYIANDRLSIFYRGTYGATVAVPAPTGQSVYPVSLDHKTGNNPIATAFGGALYFPQLRVAVNVADGRRFYFDDSFTAVSAAYTKGMGSEVVLTLTLAEGQRSFAVGDYITLHVNNGSKIGEYFLPIDAMEANGTILRFRGKYLPKEAEYSTASTFTVGRSVPECRSFVTCGNRLWGFDGKRTFYASAVGNPLCFSTGKALPTGRGGGTLITELGAPVLAMVSFKEKPALLTSNAVVQIEGTDVARLRLRACEKYGVAKGAEGTAVTVGNGLYFCSVEGLCRYSGTDTELLFKMEDETAGALAAATGSKYILRTKEYLYIYDTDKKTLVTEKRDDGLPTVLVGGSSGAYELRETAEREPFMTCVLGEFPKYMGEDCFSSVDFRSEYEGDVCSTVKFHPYHLPATRTVARAIKLDVEVEEGATLTLSVRYDNEEKHLIGSLNGPVPRALRNFALPPRPFERLYVELEGQGTYRIYSVAIQKREHTGR